MTVSNPEFESKIKRNQRGEFSDKNKENKPTVGAGANLPYESSNESGYFAECPDCDEDFYRMELDGDKSGYRCPHCGGEVNQYANETEPTIKPAETSTGYMGGTKRVGGKYEQTKTLAPKEKVALMRKDIKQLQKEGSIPADWKVRIRTDDYSTNWSARVTVETNRPFEKVPSYDEFHDAEDGSPTKRAGIAVLESLGGSCDRETYEAKRKQLQENFDNGSGSFVHTRYGGDMRVVAATPETVEAENTIRAACEQYTYSDTNAMVDYFNTDGYVFVEIRQRRNND